MYKFETTPASNIDEDDILLNMDDCAQALNALGMLLEVAIRDDSASKEISNGVYCLVKQQSENLEVLGKALRQRIREIKYSKCELNDIHEVARLSGVPWPKAMTVVTLATGLYYPESGAWPQEA